jgi:hypothetical protein
MTDIGSDISNALNGLQTVVADDLETDSLEVSGIASIGTLNVSGNATIAQDLYVYGNYFGPTITGNTGTYNFLSAGTGTINYLSSGTGSFNYLSATGAFINSLTVGTLIGGPNISGEAEGSAPTYNEIVKGMTGWTSLGTSPLQKATAMCWSDTRQEVLAVENNGISPNYINDVVVFATPTFTRSFVGQTTLFEPSGVLYQNRRSRYLVWGNPTAFSTSTLQYSTTGSSWTAISFNQTVRALAYDEVSDITVWINPGTFDCVFRSTNGGATYTQPPIGSFIGPTISMRSVGMNPYTGYYIVCGDNGRIGVSRDRGLTWTLSTVGTANWNEVVCNTRENTWVLVANSGTTNCTAYSSDNGTTWTLANSLAPYDDMVYVPQLNSFIAGANTREIFLSNTDGRTWNNMGLIGSGTWGVSHIIYIPTVSRLLVGGFDSGSPFENRLYVSEMILPTSFNSTMINPGQIITSNGNLVSITAPTISATTSLQFNGATGGTLFVDTINSNTGIYNYFSAGTGSINSFSYGSATGATLYGQTVSGPTGSFTNLGSTNLSFTSATGSTITAGTGTFQSISVQNLTGGTGYFQSLSIPNLNVPTATITNLNFTSATGSTIIAGTGTFTNLSAPTATISNLSAVEATIQGSTYNSIPGNITASWGFNVGTSFISYEGMCESLDGVSYVVAYGSVGCNGTAQSIQLHNLDGTLSATYLQVPTTCTTSMAFAVLYDKKTGSPLATFRVPRTTAGGATFLDAKFDFDNNLYLAGYINNTVTGTTFEAWDGSSTAQTIPNSTTQIPLLVVLNADDLSWMNFLNIAPNGALSTFEKVAVEGTNSVVVAGQYIHTGSNLTITPYAIPASTTKVPFMVFASLGNGLKTVRNVWWAFNNQAVTVYLKDALFVGTTLYVYIGLTSPGTYDLTDFSTTIPATVRGTVPTTSGGNFPIILRWTRTTSPYAYGLQMAGRAWVFSPLASAIFNGNAGRMAYNSTNGELYFTGRVSAQNALTSWSFALNEIAFTTVQAPFKALKTAYSGTECAGFLGAYDTTTNTMVGISPLLVESPLYSTRGETNNWMGALYVDDLGNTYVNGRIEFNNGTTNNSADTPIDLSIRLRSNTPFTFRDIGTSACVSSFILKFDSNDRLVGWSQLKVQSTDSAFAVNGFGTTLYGSKLIALCANPSCTSEITRKAHNFNDTWSGNELPGFTTPPRTMGMSYDIKVLSRTVIGNGGISVGWSANLDSATNRQYQRMEEAQIKTSGGIVSANYVSTPTLYSYNKEEPNTDSNIIPTLRIQPQGGRVSIGSDGEQRMIGNRLHVGNGLVSSNLINTTRPYQRWATGFSDCIYYWFGGDEEQISTSTEIFRRQFLVGTATNSTAYWTNRWSAGLCYMFEITNFPRDDTTFPTDNVYNPAVPTSYVGWRLPVDARTDNAVFVCALARAGWYGFRVWLCNFLTGAPVVCLGEDIVNGKDIGTGDPARNSSFIGPYNTHCRGYPSTYNEWLQFNIPQRYLTDTTYCREGEVKIAFQNRKGSDSTTINYIIGLATAPNPLSIQQRRGRADTERLFSINATTYNPDGGAMYNEEWYVSWLVANKTPQFYFCLSDYPVRTDYIITCITHSNTWESPQIKVNTAFGDMENLVFRRGAGPTFAQVQGSAIYRSCWHVYLSAEQVNRMYVGTTTGGNYLFSFVFRCSPPGWAPNVGLYPRGWAIERAYPLTTIE